VPPEPALAEKLVHGAVHSPPQLGSFRAAGNYEGVVQGESGGGVREGWDKKKQN